MPAEKPALLIIDMVKDNFVDERNLPITPLARRIIAPLNELIENFRNAAWPIVFSTDAFHEDDFIFTGRMTPHSLAGSTGAEVIDALDRRPEDLWVPKPSLSAFFKTGLEKQLAEWDVTVCAVGGIATQYCVLTSALDALAHGFKTVLLENCSAASSEVLHKNCLDLYRRNPLYPLLQVQTSRDFMQFYAD
jgi:nicotinamidase-related amidase